MLCMYVCMCACVYVRVVCVRVCVCARACACVREGASCRVFVCLWSLCVHVMEERERGTARRETEKERERAGAMRGAALVCLLAVRGCVLSRNRLCVWLYWWVCGCCVCVLRKVERRMRAGARTVLPRKRARGRAVRRVCAACVCVRARDGAGTAPHACVCMRGVACTRLVGCSVYTCHKERKQVSAQEQHLSVSLSRSLSRLSLSLCLPLCLPLSLYVPLCLSLSLVLCLRLSGSLSLALWLSLLFSVSGSLAL